MSIKLILALLGLAGLTGVAVGYFLRLIISLGKKGSMELEIRQMMPKKKQSRSLRAQNSGAKHGSAR